MKRYLIHFYLLKIFFFAIFIGLLQPRKNLVDHESMKVGHP